MLSYQFLSAKGTESDYYFLCGSAALREMFILAKTRRRKGDQYFFLLCKSGITRWGLQTIFHLVFIPLFCQSKYFFYLFVFLFY